MDIPISDEEFFENEQVEHIEVPEHTTGRVIPTRTTREVRSAPYEMAARQLPLRPSEFHATMDTLPTTTPTPTTSGERPEMHEATDQQIPTYITFKKMSELTVEMDYYNYPKGYDWQWDRYTERYWCRIEKASWYQYWTIKFEPFFTTCTWTSHLLVATNGQIFIKKWVSQDYWSREEELFTSYNQPRLE